MDCIDVLSLLKAHGGSIKNIRLYGYVDKILDRPSNIFDNVLEDGCSKYVSMRCLAIDLSYYRSFLRDNGLENKDCKYFVHGEVLLLVDKNTKCDWYSTYGTLRFGTKSNSDYVTMLVFRKSNNSWLIEKNMLDDITTDEFCGEIASVANGLAEVPESVLNLPRMYSSADKELVSQPLDSLPIEKEVSFISDGIKEQFDSRDKVIDMPEELKRFKGFLESAKSKRNSAFGLIKNKYKYGTGYEYCAKLFEALNANLKRKVDKNTATGASIIKEYLDTYGGISRKVYTGVNVKKFLVDMFSEVTRYSLTGDIPLMDGDAWTLCERAFSDMEKAYAGLLGVVMRMPLANIAVMLGKDDISFSAIVNNNPYILFMQRYLSFKDAEKLALMFGASNNPALERYKNMCILSDYVNNSACNDTVYRWSGIRDLGLESCYITNSMSCSMSTFFTGRIVTGYDTTGWNKMYGNRYKKSLTRQQIIQAVKDYTETGDGIEFDGYLTSYELLYKEVYIFDTLYKLGLKQFDFKHEDIDKYINEYEGVLGFQLEPEQRQTVHCLVNGAFCLSGSAGSGKTTTVGCLLYVRRKLDEHTDIEFGAPTGKAAKVLQGVVKEPVRTLNSLCGVSSNEDFNESESMSSSSYYIFDEMSMVTVSLLYSCLKKLTGSVGFCFVGDISQLPSIGKGLVFKNLLKFLPCVFLRVSKRSKDGSGITYNSDIINNNSERSNWKDLKQADDFEIVQCSNDEIADTVVELATEYLESGVEDVQVVTPVVKSTYAWGATRLNKRLQPIFNKDRNPANRVVIGDTNFIIGDKVIHSLKNSYGMQWYSTYRGGMFQKIWGCGVSNGEVGKLVGFYKADECTILDEVDAKPDDFIYHDTLRDDSTYDVKDGYFAVVEYEDCVSGENYYILYRLVMYEEGVLTGKDNGLLNLFYAGSTHKLQGSQADVVICCIGDVNFNGFINRNMLYTMVTRGVNKVVVVGSTGQMTRARLETADKNVLTIGGILADTEK